MDSFELQGETQKRKQSDGSTKESLEDRDYRTRCFAEEFYPEAEGYY